MDDGFGCEIVGQGSRITKMGNLCSNSVSKLEEGQASSGSGKGRGQQGSIKYGFSLVKGKANHPMEDYHVSKFTSYRGRELGLFAIYDGHLGHNVPAYLQKHLFSNILKEGEFLKDPFRSISKAYERTDQAILSHNPDLGRGGSTAVTAMLIDGRKLWVANVGDSRAVLSKRGQAIQMSTDHEPNNERGSIENRGGFVSNMPGDVARVNGQLAVSRAFGDKNLKSHLRSDPDVSNSDIDANNEILILASDGLWKVVTNQEAVDIAVKIKDPKKAAKQLADEALNRESKDDISVIVLEEGQASSGSGKGRGQQGSIKYGFSLVKGKANHPMEDYHVSKFTSYRGRELGLFAIYDGHLGHNVPAYLQKHLFSNILKEGEFLKDPFRSISKAYERTDQAILSHNPDLGRGGSTAVTAMLIDGRKLWVANVGDSRAVLSKRGQAIQMSTDHEPNNERGSIENRGGFVSNMPGDVARVNGQLAVSRAFGDKNLKSHLRSDPDVSNSDIDANNEILILASDGLWKVVTNQEAVDIAVKIKDPKKAAKQLADEALNRESKDDISVIVVRFK
ncbi:hypothetical protein SSX86_009614 [Deinandra increscens subsp. villosa]|uniref:protein-serine/threonine phosphatase n=1 Tax=Deinandra increscens subsp. villosa TaxID=3103831 RepID=A0AAP0DAT9_9ASTR